MSRAQLQFVDNADGTMSISCRHEGDFDPALQSHNCLRAISQFLPQILAPVGTEVQGDIGIRSPISDSDRYQALRALAMMNEDERSVLLEHIGCPEEPESLAGFDRTTNALVMLARGDDWQNPSNESALN